MQLQANKPIHSLNPAYANEPVLRKNFDRFRQNLRRFEEKISTNETEEHLKNVLAEFLKETWYKGEHEINTHEEIDLVIHQEKTAKSPVSVLMEVKRPGNNAQMISADRPNAKALRQLILYYFEEREERKNFDVKHLIVTNIHDWYIFDANQFDKNIYENTALRRLYRTWKSDRKDKEWFYEEAGRLLEQEDITLECTYLPLKEYFPALTCDSEKALIELYKVLAPEHLLKQPFKDDSNILDQSFYRELLYIMGLKEYEERNRRYIHRRPKNEREDNSFIESVISTLQSRGELYRLSNREEYGETEDEQLFNIALQLVIIWFNRILFLKLLEAQLMKYHPEEKQDFAFLQTGKVSSFRELTDLFFKVLAKKTHEREGKYRKTFEGIPYLNSSLFEPAAIENATLHLDTALHKDESIRVYKGSVLKDRRGKELSILDYLFEFLNAYDFGAEEDEAIQEEDKSLIKASVLGLIFEKINGYKDGSVYTPGFITMYMARETVRQSVVEKFNNTLNWSCRNLDDLREDLHQWIHDHAGGRAEARQKANEIVNSLRICDPAVGSGHFLVSVLNELLAVKSHLGILCDENMRPLLDHEIWVENDELLVHHKETNEPFTYRTHRNSDGSLHISADQQTVQQTLFREKQTIIENCLFGADINPNSVKICRLRLWIELLKCAYYKDASNPSGRDPIPNPSPRGKGTHASNSGTKEVESGVGMQLETLPNIDINIKQGNTLVSRFPLDADLSGALRRLKWDINTYRSTVRDYKKTRDPETKRSLETLINQIKQDFHQEISKFDPLFIKLRKKQNELYEKYMHKGFFDDSEKADKKALDKRKKLEKEIANLEEKIKARENDPIYRDALEWRFEFPEVLDDDGNFTGFDAVIGNPPYIRHEGLKPIKPYIKENYEVFDGKADILIYFVELGLRLLKEKGSFAYIISNKFMRAGYGTNFREWLRQYQIRELIDFGDLPVFAEATTYPCILSLSKEPPRQNFYGANVETLDFNDLAQHLSHIKVETNPDLLRDEAWVITDKASQKLVDKLMKQGQPLGEYVEDKIYRGVLTGFNEAFVVDEETKDHLIEEDEKSAEILKPFLAGRDIKRYQKPRPNKWLIFARRGIDIEQYPAIKKHLEQYRERLEPRPKNHKGVWKGRKPGSYKWYELQDAIAYYEEFEKEKIVFPNLQIKNKFTLDDTFAFVNAPSVIMPINERALLGILNSSIVWDYLKTFCAERRGGYLEVKPQYVEKIPIPNLEESPTSTKLANLVEKRLNNPENPDEIEEQIDEVVMDLYGLDEGEREVVQGEN